MEKNDIYQNQQVTGYTHDGYGVVKIDNFPIFVKYAKKNQMIDLKIIKVKKNFGYGRYLNLEKGSLKAPCPVFFECGGCQTQHFSKEEELALKEESVLRNFSKNNKKITKFDIISKTEFNYRNKVVGQFVTVDNQIKWGLYQENSHEVVVVDYCLLCSDKANEIINKISELLNFFGETVYNTKEKSGNVKRVLIRESLSEGNYLVTIVSKKGKIKNENELVNELVKIHPEIIGLNINKHEKDDNLILGTKTRTIFGSSMIKEQLCEYSFSINEKSFFQVNTMMANEMFRYVQKLTNYQNKTILDSYTGTGNIAILLSNYASKVVGVDISENSIMAANKNIDKYDLKNCEFYAQDINQFVTNSHERFDTIIIDPPRKGIDKNFVDFILENKFSEIIYISCNSATLARDINLLSELYEMENIKGFDLFPQTHHLEVVSLLKLK